MGSRDDLQFRSFEIGNFVRRRWTGHEAARRYPDGRVVVIEVETP